MSEEETTIECVKCKRAIVFEQFFSECDNYVRSVRVVQHRCPQCGSLSEAQVETGEICFGYIYAAGEPHFCGVEEMEVDGLTTLETDEGIKVFLGEGEWVIRG